MGSSLSVISPQNIEKNEQPPLTGNPKENPEVEKEQEQETINVDTRIRATTESYNISEEKVEDEVVQQALTKDTYIKTIEVEPVSVIKTDVVRKRKRNIIE